VPGRTDATDAAGSGKERLSATGSAAGVALFAAANVGCAARDDTSVRIAGSVAPQDHFDVFQRHAEIAEPADHG
jgi:hypothetical protein